jgi:hypothetical protein
MINARNKRNAREGKPIEKYKSPFENSGEIVNSVPFNINGSRIVI